MIIINLIKFIVGTFKINAKNYIKCASNKYIGICDIKKIYKKCTRAPFDLSLRHKNIYFYFDIDHTMRKNSNYFFTNTV